MGYFIKKDRHGSEGFILPAGPTSERPVTPITGLLRYNSDIAGLEYFNGTIFVNVAKSGAVDLEADKLTGDGVQTSWPLSFTTPSSKHILVFINGVYQTPGTHYSVPGLVSILFTSPPPDGEDITIIHGMGNTLVTTDIFNVS